MSNTVTEEQPKASPKKVKVTLKKSHTHAGVFHEPKSIIEVREDQRQRLIEQGVI